MYNCFYSSTLRMHSYYCYLLVTLKFLYAVFAVLCLVAQLYLTLWDPRDGSHGSSVHGDSPDKNTEVGCHAFLQGKGPLFSHPQFCLRFPAFFNEIKGLSAESEKQAEVIEIWEARVKFKMVIWTWQKATWTGKCRAMDHDGEPWRSLVGSMMRKQASHWAFLQPLQLLECNQGVEFNWGKIFQWAC